MCNHGLGVHSSKVDCTGDFKVCVLVIDCTRIANLGNIEKLDLCKEQCISVKF